MRRRQTRCHSQLQEPVYHALRGKSYSDPDFLLEKDLVRDRGIAVADMRQIDEFGVSVLIRRVIDKVQAGHGVLHVSFDVDFLDPDLAPGVGTTVPGGATYREAHLVMEMLHDSGLVRSLDIVELNPFLDERGRTARLAIELVGSLFGQQITDRPTPTNAIGPID